MTPEAAIVELGPVDLMRLAEGGEVRIGVVSIRAGAQSTCSIIGAQASERPSGVPQTTRRRPLPGEGPNVGTKKVITSLRFVRFPVGCSLCRKSIHTGARAVWCPQTKDVFCEGHDHDACLAVVLA